VLLAQGGIVAVAMDWVPDAPSLGGHAFERFRQLIYGPPLPRLLLPHTRNSGSHYHLSTRVTALQTKTGHGRVGYLRMFYS
jgi:hypothetical protein